MRQKTFDKKIIFLACAISLSACLQIFQPYFIYWKWSFFSEPWRWWTAHWVHVGWIHYLLNMAAFLFLPFIFPQLKNRFLFILIFSLPVLISLSFYYLYPNIEAYAGFSGVLHGIYVATAIYYLQFSKERKFSLLVLGLIMAKIIWENTFGSTQTAALIGSTVLVEAHLLGALWGALLSVIYLLVLYINKRLLS